MVCHGTGNEHGPQEEQRLRRTSRKKVPRVSLDYFYMSEEDEENKKNPVLVAPNETSDDKHARAARRKGLGPEGAVQSRVKQVVA